MKTIPHLLTFFCVALCSIHYNAQKDSTENVRKDRIFIPTDVDPIYIHDGLRGLLSDLYTELLKTAPAIQDSVSRRAVVMFTIVKQGLIDHNSITVLKNDSVPVEYLNAAIEAIKRLGNFTPGRVHRTIVSVPFSLPILYPIPMKFVNQE